jgi:hypothetical protein
MVKKICRGKFHNNNLTVTQEMGIVITPMNVDHKNIRQGMDGEEDITYKWPQCL